MSEIRTKIKLLIISSEFPPGPGGIGNHAYNLAKYLQEHESVEVTVLADTNFTSKSELEAFDKELVFKIIRIYRTKPIFLTYLRRVLNARKLISENDKIIFSGKFPIWVAGTFRAFFPKKDFIAVVHGSELDLPNRWKKKFTHDSLNKCNKIISVSKYTQTFLPKNVNGQQRSVIANGIDLLESAIERRDYQFGSKSKEMSLLTVGNVTPRKGQKNVIRALSEIKKVFPDVHYHIVGLPTHKDSLISFAKEWGVLSHISFHGKVPRHELLSLYKKCDIFMMLSDHTADGDFEGFGIAVLEANLWGKPAIGSRNSGIADAIDDENTGLLVNQHDDMEIAAAVAKIFHNYDSFSLKSYNWAIEHDWKTIAERYYDVIDKN